MTQMVGCLLSKHEALSLNSSTVKGGKKELGTFNMNCFYVCLYRSFTGGWAL
jgi:hypothetical protein